ncbi:hypothetical protein A2U01_0014831 [Trifolium medium]|uniref:Uncharacterized protein n=1 Tax=Trifolium medium TaxID=97028 RepID=A0A392N4G2_9FABA|nr:hypothetical protein [Trifolium medium]
MHIPQTPKVPLPSIPEAQSHHIQPHNLAIEIIQFCQFRAKSILDHTLLTPRPNS